MKIIATATTGKELKPGDLYSYLPQEYWNREVDVSPCVRLFFRTNAPLPEYSEDTVTYKIEVIK